MSYQDGHADALLGEQRGPAGEPRWLDEQEMETWLALMRVVSRLPIALDRQLQRDAGISHFEYQVMAGLSQAPERTLRMGRLADFTEGQLPRLSQVVSRLEKRGWVTRCADTDDRRSTLATLTDEGLAVLAATAPGHVEEVRKRVFDPLTAAQIKQLGAICRRIGADLA